MESRKTVTTDQGEFTVINKSELPFYYDRQCSDPYWDGCKNHAMYYRERIWSDKPDYPQFLCEGCFEAELSDGNIDPHEWQLIE